MTLSQTFSEAPITNTVAAAAATSPLWLQNLSSGAAILLPILGVTWLTIQIVHYVWKNWPK